MQMTCIQIIATNTQYMKWKFFLDEGIFLTDDSRQLTAIAYIIDLNDIKPCFKWLYFSPTNKSAQPQLYKQLVSQSKTMTLLEQ